MRAILRVPRLCKKYHDKIRLENMEEFGALDEVYKEHYGIKTEEEEQADASEAVEQMVRAAQKNTSKIEKLLVEKYKAEAAAKGAGESILRTSTCEIGTQTHKIVEMERDKQSGIGSLRATTDVLAPLH